MHHHHHHHQHDYGPPPPTPVESNPLQDAFYGAAIWKMMTSDWGERRQNAKPSKPVKPEELFDVLSLMPAILMLAGIAIFLWATSR